MTNRAGHFLLGLVLAAWFAAAQSAWAGNGGQAQADEPAAAGETPTLKLIGEFRALPLLKFLEALRLLHASETAEAADFSITATGRQFAWQYEYRTP